MCSLESSRNCIGDDVAFSCSAESVICPESEDSVEGSWLDRADILLLGEGREASEVEGEVVVEGE